VHDAFSDLIALVMHLQRLPLRKLRTGDPSRGVVDVCLHFSSHCGVMPRSVTPFLPNLAGDRPTPPEMPSIGQESLHDSWLGGKALVSGRSGFKACPARRSG